jgi:hypothetical protein
MKIISVFLCVLVLTAFNFPVLGKSFICDCAVTSVKQEYKRSKAVFVGKVTNIIENDDSKTFEFRVEKYWKGVTTKIIKVTVSKTMRFEPFYKLGSRYLIYAYSGNDGNLQTSKCTRGSEVQYVQEDFKLLGKAKRMR